MKRSGLPNFHYYPLGYLCKELECIMPREILDSAIERNNREGLAKQIKSCEEDCMALKFWRLFKNPSKAP